MIEQLRKEMQQTAANLEFERAAELRDRIQTLEQRQLGIRVDPAMSGQASAVSFGSKKGRKLGIDGKAKGKGPRVRRAKGLGLRDEKLLAPSSQP